jgi:hypothetical protein
MPDIRLPPQAPTVPEPTQQAGFAGPTFEGEEVRRQRHRRVVSALVGLGFFCGALFVCPSPQFASTDPSNRIICREELPTARRELLAAKLRAITGLAIQFDSNGALRLTSGEARGGSQTARELLRKALDGTRVLILEDASDRPDVVFARVVPGRLKHHSSADPETYVVLIDFTDFDHLLGDEAALRAFDVGWAFLHELDHVVNDLFDSTSPTETGECEAHINVMRRELGLPVRSEYFYALFPGSERSEFRTRLARLAFDQKDTTTKKRHRYWVMWDAAVVGGLTAQVATAR